LRLILNVCDLGPTSQNSGAKLAAKPNWSGSIRLSLASLSVGMFTAIDAQSKIAFHQIYKPTDDRVDQKLVA